MSNPVMKIHCLIAAGLALLVAGCSVTTHVVQLNPARTFEPTQNVEILLEKPTRPYFEIGLLESRGAVGVTEAELLNDAREKARKLGADAIVKLEAERVYQPPVAVYDPWYDPIFWHPYRYRPYPPFPHPWGAYRVIGGGHSYTMKALAIRYQSIAQ